MLKKLIDWGKSQDGAVEIIVGLSLVVLLGFTAFAVDMGLSYVQASKLQNALDSAVLAAVKELPADNIDSLTWDTAKDKAISFSSFNKISINSGDISPLYKNDNPANKIIGVKITKSMTVDYYFARVLGINSGTVTRSAAASLKPAGGLRGAVPLSITSSSLSNAIAHGTTQNLLVKCSSDTNQIYIDSATNSGWFGALRFDGKGASDYSNLLASGYDNVLQVGQKLSIETGNMSGPTMSGFSARYSRCTDGCTADSYEPGCPKLVYISVVEVLPGKQVKIVGFAAFFLTGIGGSGKNSYITATYIGDAVLSDAAAGTSGADYGTYVSKLTD